MLHDGLIMVKIQAKCSHDWLVSSYHGSIQNKTSIHTLFTWSVTYSLEKKISFG